MEKITALCGLMVAVVACYGFVFSGSTLAATAEKSTSNTKKITANCNKNNASVQKAVNKIKSGQAGIIFIKGFCNQRVLITRDDITLNGNKNNDTITEGGVAGVIIDGARRITISGLEITGPFNGVEVKNGASVEIIRSNIHDNAFDGIAAFNQVFVRVSYSTITGNGRPPGPFFESGINAGLGAVVRSSGNLIADNGYAAVRVGNMAYFRGGQYTKALTANPGDVDVILQKGCTQGQAAGTCGDLGAVAIDCFRKGACDLRRTDITGESLVSGNSNLDVDIGTINGDITGSNISTINLSDKVNGSGTLSCFTSAIAPGNVGCGGSITP